MSLKKIIILIMLIYVVYGLCAIDKNAGTKGYQFLKLPVSPELAGQANTGELQQSSPLNLLQHPAALDWQRGRSVAFAHTSWMVDTSMYNLGWRNVLFNQSFGLGVTYFDYGKLDKRTENGTLIGEYYPMDARIAGNYVRQISPSIYAGANLNFIYQKIDTSSSTALSTDLGIVYHTPLRISADLALKNIGTSSKLDQEKTELPFVMEFGLSGVDIIEFAYAYYEKRSAFSIPLNFKLVYMDDHDHLLPALGTEIPIYNMLFIRGGYKFNYNDENFSVGMGIHYKTFKIDYAFLNNKDLDDVHIIGIGWEF